MCELAARALPNYQPSSEGSSSEVKNNIRKLGANPEHLSLTFWDDERREFTTSDTKNKSGKA